MTQNDTLEPRLGGPPPAAWSMMPTSTKCPICHTETAWTGNPHRPFCSERCRFLDLGAWADGKYRIGSEAVSEDESLPADESDRQ